MPLPAGAVLAYDTRLWTEGDPTLENLGSAGAAYDLDILEDLAYDNLYGTQANDYYAFLDTTGGGIDWTDLGGTPGVAGVFTFIIATGNTDDGAGFGSFRFDATTEGIAPSVINYDGTIAGPGAVADFPDPALFVDPGLLDSYSSGGAIDDTLYFFEVDLTGTPYVEIRENQTLQVSDTKAAYGGGVIDGIYDPGNGIVFTLVGADAGWPAGAPWRMRGMAMVRGVLDASDRTEWIDYFTIDPEPEHPALIPFPRFDNFELGVHVMWDGATWTDVTEDIRELSIRYPSRSRLQAVYQAGSVSMTLDNRTRKYDPTYAAGPYFGDLKVNRRVSVQWAVSGGPAVDAWNGWTDGWSFAYDRSNNDSTATITAVDALGKAAVSSIAAGVTPTLSAGEAVVTRGTQLVAAAGSTGITYDAAAGYARFVHIWDDTRRHNLLDELRRCAELEVGPLVTLDDGTLYQENRYWFATRTGSITSNCTIPSGTLPCSDLRVVYDARELVSAVSMTGELGDVVTTTNATAVTDFGERYAELNFNQMPAADHGALEGAAATWVGFRGGEEFRFDTVRIQPQSSTDWWEQVQDRRVLDRVTVTFTPTGIGSAVTADAFLDGIEHRITPATWETTWHLLPADLFSSEDFFILDTSVLDGADVLGY